MGKLYSEKFPFNQAYREQAWIQHHYNQLFYESNIEPQFRERIAQLSSNQKSIFVTDLCCGDGFATLHIFNALAHIASEHGKRLVMTGVDVSKAQIDNANLLLQESLAEQKLPKEHLLRFVESKVETYKPRHQSDMVLCLFGLHLFEHQLQRTITQVSINLAKKNTIFLAIYPMRVQILYPARVSVSSREVWRDAFNGPIRFIKGSNQSYKDGISKCDLPATFKGDTHQFTVSKEKFKQFFSSWAPEARGLLKEGLFDEYFEAVWNEIKTTSPQAISSTQGQAASDVEESITFDDSIFHIRAELLSEKMALFKASEGAFKHATFFAHSRRPSTTIATPKAQASESAFEKTPSGQ